MLLKSSILALSLAVLFACDKGVSPSAQPPPPAGYMSGTIRYQNWPPRDSLVDLRLVAFSLFPPTNIVNEVLAGRAAVYPALGDTSHLPFIVDSVKYLFSLSPGTYEYVAVAQQFGPNITSDWRAVGQYDLDSNLTVPSPVTIVANDTTSGIDINVDFSNPPPPPF